MFKIKRNGIAAVAAVMGIVVAASMLAGMQAEPSKAYRFNAEGELIRPEGYREWVYVGTPLTPNDMNRGKAPFPEFHNVYIDRESFDEWKRSGTFRDGTILMKELVSVGSKQASSGKGYFMGEYIGLEATIKSKDRFPDEPGNWGYFSFGHEIPLAVTATAFPASDCNACHEDNAADDWVFTQFYPVLQAAKGGAATRGSAAVHDGATCPQCQAAVKRFADVTPSAKGGVPMNKDELFAFIKAGKYKSWTHEAAMRETEAPHGSYVITYLNPTLEASMTAGNETHPVGSSSVKEMFGENRKPFGYAVSVKAKPESDRGKGWYWYETQDADDVNAIPVKGTRTGEGLGAGLCVGCHGRFGTDYVVIEYPFTE
jgi:hypothetical protein